MQEMQPPSPSYRGLSPVSNHPQAPEQAAGWIPATSAETENMCVH
jgi:hypothetical protein